MFEGLLEKILLAKLGKFIHGLNKDTLKVALWRGDITLENVYLKPDALLMLQLPLVLSTGKVQKLVVKVPWSRLKSSPVELVLEGLYVVVSPQQKADWEYSQAGEVLRKKDLLDSHQLRRRQEEAQAALSQEEEAKQKTFVEALTEKIVDNLRITVKNIHVRLEYVVDGRQFSAGLILQSLECFTTNAQWEREFLERTQNNQDVHKLVTIEGLGVYWTTNETEFVTQQSEQAQLAYLTYLLKQEADYIVNPINLEAKLTHRSEQLTFEQPQYEVTLSMPDFQVIYSQQQFYDLVKLFEYHSEYANFLLKAEATKKFQQFRPTENSPKSRWYFAIKCVLKTIKQRRDRITDYFQLPVSMRLAFEEQFKMLHRKLQKTGSLSAAELQTYDHAIYLTDLESLCKWADHVSVVVESESKKAESNSGWFGFWKPKQTEESYQKLFGTPPDRAPTKLIPKSYVWLSFSFQLTQGQVQLVKFRNDRIDALHFTYSGLSVHTSKRVDGADTIAVIQDFTLTSQTTGNTEVIARKLTHEEDWPLVRLDLRTKPFEIDCEACISLTSQPFECNLSGSVLSQVLDFFIVPETLDVAKVAAWDTLQELQDSTHNTLLDLVNGGTKYIVTADICGPRIRVPAPNQAEHFLFNFGRLTLTNGAFTDQYEQFCVQVSGLQLCYANEEVISQFEVSAELGFLRSALRRAKAQQAVPELREMPELIASVKLPSFKIRLSPLVYNQLLRLQEVFELDKETWNSIKFDRSSILTEAQVSGMTQKRHASMESWSRCFTVLSGAYLYFFSHKTDESLFTYFYIKDCSLAEVSGDPEFALRLCNRFGECTLAFGQAKKLHKWKQALAEQITALQSYTSAAKADESLSEDQWLSLAFEVQSTSLTLCNDQNEAMTDLIFSALSTQVQASAVETKLQVAVRSCSITSLTGTEEEQFRRLLTTKPGQPFLQVGIQHLDSRATEYADCDVCASLTLGHLELNWNSQQLSSTLNFFQFVAPSPATNTVGRINPSHTWLDLSVTLAELDIFLNYPETSVVMGQMNFMNTAVKILLKNGGYDCRCDFENIEISDLTGYPDSRRGKYVLFTGRKDRLLKFHMFVYSEDNPDKPADLGSVVELELESVSLVYLHQPVMRIVNFFTYKMLGLFDYENKVRDAQYWSPLHKLSYLLNLSTFQSVDTRSFTSIRIHLANPLIDLRPRPRYRDSFVLDLGQISISNSPGSSSTRHATESVWLDVFTIHMKNTSIHTSSHELAKEVQVHLELERPVLSKRQQKAGGFDTQYKLTGRIDNFALDLLQEDFTLLLNLSDLNLAYDDRMNELYEDAPPIRVTDDPNHCGVFIALEMQLNLLSLLLSYENQRLAEIYLDQPQLSVIKYNDYTMEVKLQTPMLLGLANAESVGCNEGETTSELFKLPKTYSSKPRLQHVFLYPLEEESEASVFTVDFCANWEGNKDIIVEMKQFKVNFNYAVFQQIQYFFYYGFPDYAEEVETPYDYITKRAPSLHFTLKKPAAPRISLNVIIEQPLILLPVFSSTRVFVCQSDLSFTYSRERESSDWEDESPSLVKRFVAHELEVFSCQLKYLSSKAELHNIVKNKVLEPVQLMYESVEQRLSISESVFSILYQTGPIQVLLSHKDILLLKKVSDYQSSMMKINKELTKCLGKFPDSSDEEDEEVEDEVEAYQAMKSLELRHRLDSSSSSSYDEDMDERAGISVNHTYEIQSPFHKSESIIRTYQTTHTYTLGGIDLLIVNDACGAYSPLLKVAVEEVNGLGTANMTNWNVSAGVSLAVSHYNPLINTWEPLLEPCSLQLQMLTCPEDSPRNEYIVSFAEDRALNVNCSEVMTKYFFKVLDSWNSDIEYSSDSKELASPVSILNQTGYPIQIERKGQIYSSSEFVNPGDVFEYKVDYSVVRGMKITTAVVSISIYLAEDNYVLLDNVPIYRVQSLSYQVTIGNERVPVLVEVKLVNTKKLLTVSSPVVIVNETKLPLLLLLSSEDGSEFRLCEPGAGTPVPISHYHKRIGFTHEQHATDRINTYNLADIISRKKASIEIDIGGLFVVLYYTQSDQPKHSLYLRSPVVFKNRMPMDVRLLLLLPDRKMEMILKSGDDRHEHSIRADVETSGILYVAGFSGSSKIPIISNKAPTSIKVVNEKQLALRVKMFHRKCGGHVNILYPAVALINNSEMPFSFIKRTADEYLPIPGQNYVDRIIPCSNTKCLSVGLGATRSAPIDVGSVGAQGIVHFSGGETPEGIETLYQFIYQVQLTQVVAEELLFTRVVTFSPRFILLNETNSRLYIKQANSTARELRLDSKSRTPFHWPDFRKEEPQFLLKEDGEWGWSGLFTISSLGHFTVQCQHRESALRYKLIRVDIKLLDTSVFVVFEDEHKKHPLYKFVNNSSKIWMEVHQSGFPTEVRRVACNTSTPLGWTRANIRKDLSAKFFSEGVDTGYKYKFNLDKLNQNYRIPMTVAQSRIVLFARVYMEGSSKIIEFSDQRQGPTAKHRQTVFQHVSLLIPHLGLSLVEYTQGSAKELLYLTASYVRVQAEQLKKQWQVEMMVDAFQVDNQSSALSIYPVLLCPDPGNSTQILQCSVSFYSDTGTNCFNFESCEFLVQTLWLNLESTVARRVLGLIGRLLLQERAVFLSSEVFNRHQTPSWRDSVLYKSDKSFYFGTLKLCPVKVICTFLPIKDSEEEETVDAFATVAKAMGMGITAIDAAPVKLCAVELNDLAGSQRQVLLALWMNYKAQIASELLSFIGRASVFGNPVGLFNNLGTGVFDFFYEPAQGMIRGPASAGRGLLKGTKSLVSNTVQGTFGTFSKLTNSLASGITELTQNKKYNAERQRDFALNKPKNVMDGIGLGFRSLFTNITKGITGVVTEPVEGYKKNKMKGLLEGGASGVSGLLVKPVAGVLDAASITAEGIRNSAANETVVQLHRIRPPRCFYGATGKLKTYNLSDSQVMDFLARLDEGRLRPQKFVAQWVSQSNPPLVFCILAAVLVMANAHSGDLLWIVPMTSIQFFERVDKGILIYTTPNQFKKTRNKTTFLVPVTDKPAVDRLLHKLKEAHESCRV